MKTVIKTLTLGLYIVAISASLSMAAEKVDGKVNCPASQSREERDLVISESAAVINDKEEPSQCLKNLIQMRRLAVKNIGTKTKVDAEIVSDLVTHVWKEEVANVEAQNINN